MKRNEKGSITLFTLIAMIFLVTIAFTAYASAMIKLQAQNEDLERIKASYEQDITKEGLASLQEELITQKPYTVTFDANGGTVDLPSKEVKYGREYGKLPTPTREGYRFQGWNGKNKFNYENILDNNSQYVSKGELNGVQTIYWTNDALANNSKFLKGYFKENTQYIFSGNIASSQNNRMAINIVYRDGTNYFYDFGRLRSISSNPRTANKNEFNKYTFISDSTKSIDYINGTHSASEIMYIDINSFQIEEGTEATEYEPYFITSDTQVTQKKDHTLTAIWDEGVPPTLELSKETYIEEDFSDWELSNARVIVEDGKNVLLIGENGNAGNAFSNYYETQGGKWVPYYEAYTTVATSFGQGGVHNGTEYFNQNYASTKDISGYSGNGVAFGCNLNQWTPSTVDNRYNLTNKFPQGYGNNIKYIQIKFVIGNQYSQPPVKIRNFKMIGEAIPNSFYNINITSSDNVGVTTTKYEKGVQTAEYFETNGKDVENNQIRVTENGTYTVCVGDKAGNKTVKTIEITDIK